MRRNALLAGRGISWGVLALLFALLALIVRLIAPNFFWTAFSPLFRVSDAVSAETHILFNNFGNAAELAASNETLSDQNTALTNENQALLEKVAGLATLLGTPGGQKSAGIIAGVVARPPASPYDTLVLAAGTSAGVVLGMEAFGAGGVPLGIVSSVTADFSRVTLLSAAGTHTDGWVAHATPLTIRGEGAGALVATVARSAGVAVGDVVSAPGPGMLPIGRVVRVDSDPLSPAVTLRIKPAMNPFSVTWVELRATGVAGTAFVTSTDL